MRFMDSTVLTPDNLGGDALAEEMQTAVGMLELKLRQKALDAGEAVVRWSVNCEFRRTEDAGSELVRSEDAGAVHLTVLLLTTPDR